MNDVETTPELRRRRLCLVVSSPGTVRASFVTHLSGMVRRFDVTVVANTTDFRFLEPLGPAVTNASIRIERNITLMRDIAALWRLFVLLRGGNYDAVYSVTPKAGLLSMLAGWMARVPVRVHTFTGQVWVTARGPLKEILCTLDHMIAALATHILVDSHSQMEFLIHEGVIRPRKASVLANGSICGVDLLRFAPNPAARAATRAALGIDDSVISFLFVGRLKKDKGVFDLANAFVELNKVRKNTHLIIIGPDEEQLRTPLLEIFNDCAGGVTVLDFTDRPEDFMAASDVLCLPSYREGFGSVMIEAGAVGIPSIGSRIYGITDAIVENVTGLLHTVADPASLYAQMLRMVDEPELRRALAANAHARAIRDFPAERVTTALVSYLVRLT